MHAAPLADGPVIARALLADLPERLRQPTFERTGGLHATGLFTPDGRAAVRARGRRPPQRDGQGRSAGRCARALVPLHPRVLCVSGRLSFELVQKAAVAGAPVLVGRGRADVAGRPARRRPRADPVRVRPRRPRERLHVQRAGGLTAGAGGGRPRAARGGALGIASILAHSSLTPTRLSQRAFRPPSLPISSTWNGADSRSRTSSSRSSAPAGSARSASICSRTSGSPAGPETISSRRLMTSARTPYFRRSVPARRSDREPRSRETRKIGRVRGRGSPSSRS